MAVPGQLLLAPEVIRTGGGSFVDLVLAVNGRVLVDAQSQIEVRRLGASPLIWLESGKLTVTSPGADVQIQTKFGLFSAAEWPFEMELTNSGGTLNVVVTEGRIKTQNLDASSVTFGASENKAFRTYTAGTIYPRGDATSASSYGPNLFVQPCIVPGNTGAAPPVQNPPRQAPRKQDR
jgi:ferric-dicitrate binding protein FerR (iron transport regulator)